MKAKIISIIILIAISLNGMAQDTERRTIIRTDNRGIVESVEYSIEDKTVPIPRSAEEFFNIVLRTQTADRFERVPHRSNRADWTHEHFNPLARVCNPCRCSINNL